MISAAMPGALAPSIASAKIVSPPSEFDKSMSRWAEQADAAVASGKFENVRLVNRTFTLPVAIYLVILDSGCQAKESRGGVAQGEFLRNWESQARKGSLELVVMSALSVREYYGYELVEHLHSACGLYVKDGTLYAILIRLQKEGLIQHRWEHMPTGPARKYYALTKAGVSALASMRSLWLGIARAVDPPRGRK